MTHSQLITTVYSDYKWLPWKFIYTPRNFWKDSANCRLFLEHYKQDLNIKNNEDWANISAETIINLGGPKNIKEVVTTAYPEIKLGNQHLETNKKILLIDSSPALVDNLRMYSKSFLRSDF
jgi:hypothetical protein